MKRIFLTTTLLLILAACGGQNTQIVENVIIELKVEPEPPVAGDATLLISVNEADGTAIDGATVAVHGDMDHEGMEAVDREVSESISGVYRVPFEWTMGGGWILDVTVTLPDNRGIVSRRFEFTVGAVSQNSVINRNASADGITIRYSSENDPATTDDASVTIIVLDQAGVPLENVTVSVLATMPDHDTPPVFAQTENSSNGRYVMPLRWTMAGQWEVVVTIMLADGTMVSQAFEQTVVISE